MSLVIGPYQIIDRFCGCLTRASRPRTNRRQIQQQSDQNLAPFVRPEIDSPVALSSVHFGDLITQLRAPTYLAGPMAAGAHRPARSLIDGPRVVSFKPWRDWRPSKQLIVLSPPMIESSATLLQINLAHPWRRLQT